MQLQTSKCNICVLKFWFQDLFVTFELVSCVEMTLGGDVKLSMVDRLKWNVVTPSVFPGMIASLVIMWGHVMLTDSTDPQVDPTTITLTPMMIRTFICNIKYTWL